jgi:hypothetical protein
MALYFLVEGRQTEARILPEWFTLLLPHHSRTFDPTKAADNEYFLISGNGMPQLVTHGIPNSLADISANPKFNYFIIVVDADDVSVADRDAEIRTKLASCSVPPGTNIHLVIQNICVETWLLGNRKIYRDNPVSAELRRYRKKYDTKEKCPEGLSLLIEESTLAQFHLKVLKLLFVEKNIWYSKVNPGPAKDIAFLQMLIRRLATHSKQLPSFAAFLKTMTAVA